jgi:hypothetical protein
LNARDSGLPAAAALAAMLVTACTSFDDVSTVVDLRVLGVETEPSEVVLTITGLPADPAAPIDPNALAIDPTSIPPVRLTPLIVDPRPGTTPTFSLVACPNNPYGAAPPMNMGGGPDPSGGARSSVGSTICAAPGPGVPTWDFGAGHPAAGPVEVQLTPDQLLEAFKRDIYLDQYGQIHGGFDLGMPLNLQLTVTSGDEHLIAIKRVLFWATMLPGQVPNRAPEIVRLDSYRERDEKTWELIEPAVPLEQGTTTRVALGTSLWLLPNDPRKVPLEDIAESYVTTVISRDPPHRAVPMEVERERIRYAFYATAGHFDPPRTVSELIPGVPGMIHLESKYVPPATLDGVPVDPVTGDRLVDVWIVVRDDRGGESWVARRIALDPAP